MNKLFIILLAICLVSVHAFVKRDAPEAPKEDTIEKLIKDGQELFKTAGEKLSATFNAENIKNSFGTAVDNIKKAVDGITPKDGATAAPSA